MTPTVGRRIQTLQTLATAKMISCLDAVGLHCSCNSSMTKVTVSSTLRTEVNVEYVGRAGADAVADSAVAVAVASAILVNLVRPNLYN